MANSLDMDITNKRVLLMKRGMKPEFHEEKFRKVLVHGGFGSVPYTEGRHITVTFECDGEECGWDSMNVERLLRDDE